MKLKMRLNLFPTVDLPPSDCPCCGKTMDEATATDVDEDTGGLTIMDDGYKPDPGALMICSGCLAFLRFDEQMKLRTMDEAEFNTLPEAVRNHLTGLRDLINRLVAMGKYELRQPRKH